MTLDEAMVPAAAYRRAGRPWWWIGKHLGIDKDRLREAMTAKGMADGWGDSPIRRDGWGEGKSATSAFAAAAHSKGR
jgi:hypothetical protein